MCLLWLPTWSKGLSSLWSWYTKISFLPRSGFSWKYIPIFYIPIRKSKWHYCPTHSISWPITPTRTHSPPCSPDPSNPSPHTLWFTFYFPTSFSYGHRRCPLFLSWRPELSPPPITPHLPFIPSSPSMDIHPLPIRQSTCPTKNPSHFKYYQAHYAALLALGAFSPITSSSHYPITRYVTPHQNFINNIS